ncbi:MAG: TIGR04255 family protein [Verrucomicrobia bacterium]|nr:TIGR04255 family protein [Verrucomicrobiota bacterium]
MARIRHLSRAPIVEALVDLRVKTRADFDIATVPSLHEQLQPTYARKEEMRAMELSLVQAPGKPPEQRCRDLGKHGFRFLTQDGVQIVQFRRDGFTFNRLAPYTCWEEVFGEASRLWKGYESVVPCEEVTRIAVRYINRLLLPLGPRDLSAFLVAPPPIPKDLNVVPGAFLSRVTVHPPEGSLAAHVTQALRSGAIEEKTPVILDIDAFETGAFPPRSDALLPRFAALRKLKNEIFFSSLTEEAVSLFE